jgi:hypothetical protein
MPRRAIERGVVDQVLGKERIADAIEARALERAACAR